MGMGRFLASFTMAWANRCSLDLAMLAPTCNTTSELKPVQAVKLSNNAGVVEAELTFAEDKWSCFLKIINAITSSKLTSNNI